MSRELFGSMGSAAIFDMEGMLRDRKHTEILWERIVEYRDKVQSDKTGRDVTSSVSFT